MIISSGAKVDRVVDYESADGLLRIERYYRSQIDFSRSDNQRPRGSVGGWRFNFGLELQISEQIGNTAGAAGVTLHTPDGVQYDFNRNGNIFYGVTNPIMAQSNYRVEYVGPTPIDWNTARDQTTYWRVIDSEDRVWLLTSVRLDRAIGGQLSYLVARPTEVTHRNGYKQTFNYSSDGVLQSISDNLNRSVSLTWRNFFWTGLANPPSNALPVPEAIAEITPPTGGKLRYTYDPPAPAAGHPSAGPAERLVKMEQLDAASAVVDSATYHYENPSYRDYLTGITDHRNVRVATYAYDASGRAISTESAGGQGKYTIAYGGAGPYPGILTRTVTNPLGKAGVYSYEFDGDSYNVRRTTIQGQPSTNCPASSTALTYGPNGFIATETDEEGRVTSYLRDALGRPTSITRGNGTPQATTTTVAWHPTLNVPSQVIEPGLTTDLTWNALGQLSQVKQTDTTTHTVPFSTNGRTRIWSYGYGVGGLLQSADGPLAGTGDETYYAYNGSGYLQIVNEQSRLTTVTAWNGRGQPTSVTDQNGRVTSYGYDPLGRVTSISVDTASSPLGWSMTYTAAGDLATLAEPGGALYTLTWDDARRLTKIQNNLGESISYARDAMGNATARQIKAADGTTVTFSEMNTFDELGRLITQVGGQNRTWRFGYDKTSNLTGVTDPRNKSLAYGYDAVSRLITETERDAGVVTRTYNGKDEEVAYQDPRNLTTGYVRNGFGEVIQESSPDRGVTVYDHDARGLLTYRKDARNVVANYAYDGSGRLTSRSYPSAPALNATFTYDATAGGNAGIGRLTSSTDAAASTSLAYDGKGRVTSETRTIGGVASVASYAYDSSGRLSTLTYPSGRAILYGYDALGRIATVRLKRTPTSAEESIAAAMYYLPFGDVRGATLANAINMYAYYDKEYRIDQLYVNPAAGGASLVARLHPIGDGLNLTGLNNNATSPAETQSFGYDDAARLPSANGPYGSRTWTYDKVGNRLTEATTSGGTTTNATYSYPAASNRLASITVGGTATRSFVYDAAGSTTTDTRAGTAYGFTINDAGRISALSVGGTARATYLYDGKNRLSVRTLVNGTPSGATRYLYDKDDRLIAETDGSGTTTREYVWAGDLPLAVLDGSASTTSPTLLWVHADHLKRPELMTNAAGAVVWKALYQPFGAVHSTPARPRSTPASPASGSRSRQGCTTTGTATTTRRWGGTRSRTRYSLLNLRSVPACSHTRTLALR